MSGTNYANTNEKSPEVLLESVAESLQQEANHLNIQGRPLTADEQERVRKIGSAIELINKAKDELSGGGSVKDSV